LLVVATAGFLWLRVADGPAVWLALLALLAGPLIATAILLRAEAKAARRQFRTWEPLVRLALVLGAVLGGCTLIEAYLDRQTAVLDSTTSHMLTADENWFQLPEEVVRLANARAEVRTLPDDWRRREETIEGGRRSPIPGRALCTCRTNGASGASMVRSQPRIPRRCAS
jgi:hypothetical protein